MELGSSGQLKGAMYIVFNDTDLIYGQRTVFNVGGAGLGTLWSRLGGWGPFLSEDKRFMPLDAALFLLLQDRTSDASRL